MHETLSGMSGHEFIEWMAYEQLEPFGPLADEFRHGQVCATLANVNRGRDTDAYSAADFMPALHRALNPPAQSIEMTDAQHADWMDAALFGVKH